MRSRSKPAAPYRVGGLARLTRVSVRTLHYYEEIGLLEPTSRSQSGHRWRELTRQTVVGFTGGDPRIASSLNRMYQEQPVDRIHSSFDASVFAYMQQACKLLDA